MRLIAINVQRCLGGVNQAKIHIVTRRFRDHGRVLSVRVGVWIIVVLRDYFSKD